LVLRPRCSETSCAWPGFLSIRKGPFQRALNDVRVQHPQLARDGRRQEAWLRIARERASTAVGRGRKRQAKRLKSRCLSSSDADRPTAFLGVGRRGPSGEVATKPFETGGLGPSWPTMLEPRRAIAFYAATSPACASHRRCNRRPRLGQDAARERSATSLASS
jgi:hypothetical protein